MHNVTCSQLQYLIKSFHYSEKSLSFTLSTLSSLESQKLNLSVWLLSSKNKHLRFFHVFLGAVSFFLSLRNITLYRHTTVCLYIYLIEGILVVFSFRDHE